MGASGLLSPSHTGGKAASEKTGPGLYREGRRRKSLSSCAASGPGYQSVSTFNMAAQVPVPMPGSMEVVHLPEPGRNKAHTSDAIKDTQAHNYMSFSLVRRYSLCQLLAILLNRHSQGEFLVMPVSH